MPELTCLVLEDGSVYRGEVLGAGASASGEVVFNTSMMGYQEMITDPSYAGQILVPTYPLMGNYGINCESVESDRIQIAGLVVRQHSLQPSHFDSIRTLHEYLLSQGIVAITGIDTRALTRRIRRSGVMMGSITNDIRTALDRLKKLPRYEAVDLLQEVTTSEAYEWRKSTLGYTDKRWRIVVADFGVKYNILRILRDKGCQVTVLPGWATSEDVLSLKPHGVVFSPGPGDPALLDYATKTVKGIIGKVPVMGICLGHQLLGRALGMATYKLKFGHRGGNHPVRDAVTGRVYITSQNHGYAVDADSLPANMAVSHINLNDGTVEGLHHLDVPMLSIQYHSEASPGPRDNEYLFDRFLDLIKEVAR